MEVLKKQKEGLLKKQKEGLLKKGSKILQYLTEKQEGKFSLLLTKS